MRIAFFGQTGPYAPHALRYLLQHAEDVEIVLVVEGVRDKVGRHDYRYEKPDGKAALLPAGEDLTALGLAAGVPVLVTSDVNGAGSVHKITQHAPDYIVCVGFDRLFSKNVLATAAKGGINVHPSKLPEWRGPSPIFWALKEGRRELGVTVHALDAAEDHGVIYAQQSFIVPHAVGGDEIYEIAARLAGELLVPVLRDAAAGTLVGKPQDHTKATRAPRAKPEDALIDPMQWTCERLMDFACGAPFFRTPWLRLGEDAFFVRRGVSFEVGKNMPGQYLQHGNLLWVQCKDGVVCLDVQV